MSVRVLLVDDQPMIRQGIRRLVEQDGLHVVGETQDGAEAHLLAAELGADVVVLGLMRPLEDFLFVAGEIHRAAPRAGMILVAFEDYLVVRAFQAGIRGYVLRTRVVEELPLAIHAVAAGKIYVSPSISPTVAEVPLATIDHRPSGT
jgi:DNA-binding NarL/FixJ family response regulator